MRQILIAATLLACASALPAPGFEPPGFHLPVGATPLKHTVELTIDARQETFAGTVRIDMELAEPISVLWLHAKGLTPRRAAVTFAGRELPARAQATGEFLGVELDSAAGPGPATVSIGYQGRLASKDLLGPHRRKIGGEWYVYTTFTPIEARRAFPCFDEPRFKTPWEISLRVRQNDRAFSNAAEISSTQEPNGWKLVRFAETPPLPAEVVAFAVGPFDVLDAPIRVITPKGRAEEGRFAASTAPEILRRIEEFTGSPYAFGKLDLMAVPDSTFGAVENPGLITFREGILLLREPEDAADRGRGIRSIQAHEFAHQWFGNLVTQATWEDVWLSEGFATWLAARIVDEPLATVLMRERFMQGDAAGRARAVRVAVNSREASEDVYNGSVYSKGAAILTMLEGWLGAASFQRGLRLYLDRHRFANASTADLADALHEASGIDPSRVLEAFLDFSGVPQVEGDLDCGRRVLRITTTKPNVPACWRAEGGAGCAVVESEEEIALPEVASCPTWFYLNAGGTGYYRTRWTSDPTAALPYLTPEERQTLVFDLRATGGPFAGAVLERLGEATRP